MKPDSTTGKQVEDVDGSVPSLRFPEFSGNWQFRQVGDLLSIGSGKDYKHLRIGTIPVYGTGGLMLHVNNYLYDGKSIGIGRKGTIDKPQFLQGKFWTVDTLFYTYQHGENIPEFLYSIFERINWQKYNEASGVPSLSKSTIEKIGINIPTQGEQQKIANFITAINKRMSVLEAKLSLLQRYKRGVVQQIFSQQVRFKDENGQTYPEWTEWKLGKLEDQGLIKLGRGDVISKTDIANHTGDYPIYSSSAKNDGLFGRYGRYMFDEELVTWSIDGGGYFFYRPGGKFSITNVSGWMRITSPHLNCRFMFYQLRSLHERLTFDYQTKAHPSTIRQLYKLKIPIIEEQRKIAAFLAILDEKIAAEQARLDIAKGWKKGLLQKMFI